MMKEQLLQVLTLKDGSKPETFVILTMKVFYFSLIGLRNSSNTKATRFVRHEQVYCFASIALVRCCVLTIACLD